MRSTIFTSLRNTVLCLSLLVALASCFGGEKCKYSDGEGGCAVTMDEYIADQEYEAQQAEDDYEDYQSQKHWEEQQTAEANSSYGDIDCDAFDTQRQAQAYYREHPEDWDWLDGDDDGYACELLP